MSSTQPADYFDKARNVAAAVLVAAAAAAILGSFLDWVTIEPPGRVPADQADRLATFTGVEATDGWYIIIAAGVMLLSTVLLLARRRSFYAWLCLIASMIIGGVAVADYRGIDEIFYRQMNRIGDPSPAIGITLVAAAGVVGVLASAAGIAATPRRD